MNEQRNILLSSKPSFLMMYIAVIGSIFFIPIMFLVVAESGFHIGTTIGIILYIFALFVLYSIFSSVCEACIIGDTLELKKYKEESQIYTFDKISTVRSSIISRSRYTNLKMIRKNGEIEFYLITNNTSLLVMSQSEF